MSDRDEKLSSLLDDYRHTDEDRAVLDQLQGDVNQQYTLRRYQMIGNVMRNEISDTIDIDFEARIKSRIAQEPNLHVSGGVTTDKSSKAPGGLWSILFKPVAGLAVAATVAIVTVSSLQIQQPSGSDNAGVGVASIDSSKAKVEQLASTPVIINPLRVSGKGQNVTTPSGTTWKIKRSKPDMQSKLNTYLINHNEYSNSMQGIIPQARVVGFDGDR